MTKPLKSKQSQGLSKTHSPSSSSSPSIASGSLRLLGLSGFSGWVLLYVMWQGAGLMNEIPVLLAPLSASWSSVSPEVLQNKIAIVAVTFVFVAANIATLILLLFRKKIAPKLICWLLALQLPYTLHNMYVLHSANTNTSETKMVFAIAATVITLAYVGWFAYFAKSQSVRAACVR